MLQPGNLESTDRLTSSCLVELSVVAAQGQDQIQEDMKNFAEQLKPYPFKSYVIMHNLQYFSLIFHLLKIFNNLVIKRFDRTKFMKLDRLKPNDSNEWITSSGTYTYCHFFTQPID